MKIPESIIDELRRSIDIVDQIGKNVNLKKRGKNYLGLCPFHKEKTPSFSVSADKGLYYCFGCKKSGNIFTFIMETQNMSYPEAIEFLAEQNGIKIEYEKNTDENNNEIEKLYKINSTIAKIFSRNLNQSEEGKFPLKYLLDRNLINKSIFNFEIGYSFKNWDNLYKEATESEGIEASDLIKLGLIKKREDGSCYDTFRGRIIFPITNQIGKIVAFGARKIYEDDPLGKYINSPETLIYKKSRVLYGLNYAKEAIRENENVIVVEGYMDLISLHQNEIKNVVATSGTAFTIEQAKLISRYTKKIIFVYDSDIAGTTAMNRGIDIILSEGLDVKIALLPEGDDPDSFIHKFGSQKFKEIILNSIDFVEFKTQKLYSDGKFATIEGKAESVRQIVITISKIPDPLKRAFFIKDLAKKFDLYESTLQTELEKILKKGELKFNEQNKIIVGSKLNLTKQKDLSEKVSVEEKELLISIFNDPAELIPFIFQNVSLDEIENSHIRNIIEELLRMFEEESLIDERKLQEQLTDETAKQMIAEFIFNKYELSSRWDDVGSKLSDARWFEVALGAIKKIKKRFLENELKINKSEMQNAASNNFEIKEYLERQHQILNQIKEIENIKLKKEQSEDKK